MNTTILMMKVAGEFQYGRFSEAEVGTITLRARTKNPKVIIEDQPYTEFGWLRVKRLAGINKAEGIKTLLLEV